MSKGAFRTGKLLVGVFILGAIASGSGYAAQVVSGAVTGGTAWLTSDPRPSNATNPSDVRGNWTTAEAKGYQEYALWWLGDEYEGLSVTSVYKGTGVVTLERPGIILRDNSISFMYGDCEAKDHQGCAPPYQVIIERNCDIRPDLIPGYIKNGAARAFRGGATLQEFGDGHVQITTGPVTVTLFGPTADAVAQMANELRSMNLPKEIGPRAALAPAGGLCGGDTAVGPL
jgi:hypothetical protein